MGEVEEATEQMGERESGRADERAGGRPRMSWNDRGGAKQGKFTPEIDEVKNRDVCGL